MMDKNQITAYDLTWLTSPISPTRVNQFTIEHQPYLLPPEVGVAWLETLALLDGVSLYRAVHQMEPSPLGQLIPIMDIELKSSEPIFNAQVWTSGRCCHQERSDNNPVTLNIVAEPGHDTFRFHREWSASILIEGGITSEMRSITIPQSILNKLLGESTMELLNELQLGSKKSTVVRQMPLHVSKALRDAMDSHMVGPIQKLHAQACALHYLANLMSHLFPKKQNKNETRHQGRIHELHDHLIHLDGRVPTLTELSEKFGLSARRLNEEFALQYGTSIYKFMSRHRLQQAHDLLRTSNTPMKVISMNLGYSHVNHFISAFKRQFGYSPGSLRHP